MVVNRHVRQLSDARRGVARGQGPRQPAFTAASGPIGWTSANMRSPPRPELLMPPQQGMYLEYPQALVT